MNLKAMGREKEVKFRPKSGFMDVGKSNGPKHVYMTRMIDMDRDSPTYGKQVLMNYRFVHGDGYEVCLRVPIEICSPFINAGFARS